MTKVAHLRNANEEPVEGVVHRLEQALELAKRGELRSVAIVGLKTGDVVWTCYDYSDLVVMMGQIEILKIQLMRDEDGRIR